MGELGKISHNILKNIKFLLLKKIACNLFFNMLQVISNLLRTMTVRTRQIC